MSNNWYEKRKINQSHVLYERLTNKLLNQKFNILKEMKGEDLVKRLRDAVTNAGDVSVSRITPEVFLSDLDAVIRNTKNTPAYIASAKKLKSLLDNNTKAQLWLDAHAQAVADGDAGAVSRLFKDPELELRTKYFVNDFSKVGREPEFVSPVSPKSQETGGMGRIVPQNVTSRSQQQIENLVQDVASSRTYYEKIKKSAKKKVAELYKIHTNNNTQPLEQAEFFAALNQFLKEEGGSPKTYDMAELSSIFSKEIAAAMPAGEWGQLTKKLGLTVASLPQKILNGALETLDDARGSDFAQKVFATLLGLSALGGAGYVGYSMFTKDIATFNRMDCTSTLVSGARNAEYKGLPQYTKCEVLARKILASNSTEEQDVKDKIDFKTGLNAFPELKPLVKEMETPPAAPAPAPNALTWQNAPDGSKAKFVDQGNKWYVYKEKGSWYYQSDNSKMDDADLKGITEIIEPER